MFPRIQVTTEPGSNNKAEAAAAEEMLNIAMYWFPQSAEGMAGPYRGSTALYLALVCIELKISMWEVTPALIDEVLMKLVLPATGVETMAQAEYMAGEFLAFWQFCKRRYKPANADAILAYIAEIEPPLPEMIYNASGSIEEREIRSLEEAAGFNMDDDAEADRFYERYLASLATKPKRKKAKQRKKAKRTRK